MKKLGLMALVLAVAVALGMGQKASEDTVTLAIVAIVIVFGLVCALLAFLVYSGVRETQAYAARPFPPAVVYLPSPVLPQAQQQLTMAMALPRGVVEGTIRELPELFYPKKEGGWRT